MWKGGCLSSRGSTRSRARFVSETRRNWRHGRRPWPSPPPPKATVPTIAGVVLSADNEDRSSPVEPPADPRRVGPSGAQARRADPPGHPRLISSPAEACLVLFWLRGFPESGEKAPELDLSVSIADAEGRAVHASDANPVLRQGGQRWATAPPRGSTPHLVPGAYCAAPRRRADGKRGTAGAAQRAVHAAGEGAGASSSLRYFFFGWIALRTSSVSLARRPAGSSSRHFLNDAIASAFFPSRS